MIELQVNALLIRIKIIFLGIVQSFFSFFICIEFGNLFEIKLFPKIFLDIANKMYTEC